MTHSHPVAKVCISFCATLGQGNVKAQQVADAMLDAVIDVLSQNPSGPLNTVRIVIFQPHMLKDFYNSMQEREASDPKDKVGFFGNVFSKIKCKSNEENHFGAHSFIHGKSQCSILMHVCKMCSFKH